MRVVRVVVQIRVDLVALLLAAVAALAVLGQTRRRFRRAAAIVV